MIKNVTLIGAGLMGAGIAAHLTNAGTHVTLLDIPDNSSHNRNNLADQAVSKLTKLKPAAFTLPKNANLIKDKTFAQNLEQIPKHGNVVLYCHLGIRSNAARAWVEAQGIPISHLNGGIEAWLFDQGF